MPRNRAVLLHEITRTWIVRIIRLKKMYPINGVFITKLAFRSFSYIKHMVLVNTALKPY